MKIGDTIFEEFKAHVLKHRKFKSEHLDQIFSADVVNGLKGKEIGLIDDIGMASDILL